MKLGKVCIFENFTYEFIFCYCRLKSFFDFVVVDIVGIIVPDMDIVLDQESDIGVSSEEPEEFSDYSFPVDFFGCEEWESIGKVEAELSAKKTIRHISASEIFVIYTIFYEIFSEVEVLLFWMNWHVN